MTASDFWSSQAAEDASEPTKIFPSLWRFKRMIIVVTVVAAGLAYAASIAATAADLSGHTATEDLLIVDPRSAGVFPDQENIDLADFLEAQAALATSTQVLAMVSEAIDGRLSIGQLNDIVDATVGRTRDVVVISVTDDTSDGARQIVGAVRHAYEEVALNSVIRHTDAALTTLEASLAELRSDIAKIDAELVAQGEIRTTRLASLVTAEADLVALENAEQTAEAARQIYQDLIERGVHTSADLAISADLASLELEAARASADMRARIADLEIFVTSIDNVFLARGSDRELSVAAAAELVEEINQLEADTARYGSGVYSFEANGGPGTVPPPSPKRNAVLGGVLGLMGAGVYAWWLGERRRIADDRHDAAGIFAAPLLGVVPDLEAVGATSRAPTLSEPASAAAEAYHFVASSMERYFNTQDVKVVLVTSPNPGDGRTVTALNLAVAVARGGRRVILVDGDRRTHGLTTQWSALDDTQGMTDLIQGASVTDCLRPWPDAPEDLSLSVVSAGTGVKLGSGLFRTAGFERALSAIAEQGDVVVVDGAPILAVADALTLAARADGIVLVVPNGAPIEALEDTRERLSNVATPILGYVFNQVHED